MEYCYLLGLACTVQKYCNWWGMQIKIVTIDVPEATFPNIFFFERKKKKATLKACTHFSKSNAHKFFVSNITHYLPLPSGLLSSYRLVVVSVPNFASPCLHHQNAYAPPRTEECFALFTLPPLIHSVHLVAAPGHK